MKRLLALSALGCALLCAQPALAQSAGGPPATYSNAGGTQLPATVTQVIGLENGNGAKCIVGSDATCQLPGSGGGGGAGAVFGPTAVGSPSANPPIQIGGTADGSATGSVGTAKITSDGLVHVSVDSGGGTGGTSSSYSAAFPATGTAVGVSNGANMVPIVQGQATMAASLPVAIASNQGNLPVSQATASSLNATVVQGTATNLNAEVFQATATSLKAQVSVASGGIASGGVASGAIASGAVASGAIVSGACVSGCITDLGTAQGATTSGLKGPLVQGAVTTAAPAYTTGQTDPVSLDTAGNVRVNCTTGCAAPAAATHAQTAALASSLVACASACTLQSIEVSADSTLAAAEWWVMVFDATSAPADGAVTPAQCFAVTANSPQGGYTSVNASFTAGATIVASSTGCFTKTASAHAFIGALHN